MAKGKKEAPVVLPAVGQREKPSLLPRRHLIYQQQKRWMPWRSQKQTQAAEPQLKYVPGQIFTI